MMSGQGHHPTAPGTHNPPNGHNVTPGSVTPGNTSGVNPFRLSLQNQGHATPGAHNPPNVTPGSFLPGNTSGNNAHGQPNGHNVTPGSVTPGNTSGVNPFLLSGYQVHATHGAHNPPNVTPSSGNTSGNNAHGPPQQSHASTNNNAHGQHASHSNAGGTPRGGHAGARTGGFGAANMSVAFGRNSRTLVNAARAHDDGVYCSANPSLNIPPMPVRGNAASYLPIFDRAAPPPGLSPNQQFSYAFWAWIWIVWEATARPPQWMLLHSIVSRSVTIDEYHHASRNFLATIAYCSVEGMNNRPPGRNVGSVAAMMNDPQWQETATAMTSFITYVANNFVNLGRNEVTTLSVQTANIFSHWETVRSKLRKYGCFGCHRVALALPHVGAGTNLEVHQLVNSCRGLYINQYRLYRMLFRDFTISRGNVVIPREHLMFTSPEENDDVEQDVLLYNA